MKSKVFIFIPLMVIFSCHSSGQQKAKKPQVNPTVKTAKEIIADIPVKSYENLNPGDIAPDAVKIDADEICTIINGSVLITKGDAQALIDLQGKFIVPWGKYKFTSHCQLANESAAVFLVRDHTLKYGFINSKGEIIVPCIYQTLDQLNGFKLAEADTKDFRNILIDLNGNEYPSKIQSGLYSGSIDPFYKGILSDYPILFEKNKRYGFAKPSGRAVIPAQYGRALQFSEGLAAVSKSDEFGQWKWGYIDYSGKTVIPFTYSLQPGSFSSGLAIVSPAEQTDFDYAFIDKKGNIKVKIGNGKRFRKDNIHQASYIKGWLANSYTNEHEDELIDTNGVAHKISEIIETPSLRLDKTGFKLIYQSERGILIKRSKYTMKNNLLGMMDEHGKIIFPLAFEKIYPDQFSPYAIAWRSTDPYGNNLMTGIINQQGVYVMVFNKKPTF